MKDLINKLYKNHSLLYKILLFVSTTFLIVYLFPKSGKFKYSFEKGKPWQSENLYAPFDFAIKKTEEEIAIEKKKIAENSQTYFDVNVDLITKIKEDYQLKFPNEFPDSVRITNKSALKNYGESVLNTLYDKGVLDKDYNYTDDKEIMLLNDRVQLGTANYGSLIPISRVTSFLDN